MKLDVSDDIDYGAIAEKAADYSGADIEKLCGQVDWLLDLAGEEVAQTAHFLEAIDYVVPTVYSNQEMVDDALATCTNTFFLPESLRAGAGRRKKPKAAEEFTGRI
jgi:SpoVK/Ycf46/Vps4 family AAA+-type ATPase